MLNNIEIKLDLNKLISQAGNSPLGKLAEIISTGMENLHLKLYFMNEKARIKHEKDLKDFSEKVHKSLQDIKTENITDPNIPILGPSLESATYYIEHEELRKIFANLIARSGDKSYSNILHVSFPQIVKELEPIDAKLLTNIPDMGLAVVDYRIRRKDSGAFNTIYLNAIELSCNSIEEFKKISVSISNLSRLGLLEVFSDKYISEDSLYDWSKHSNLYDKMNYLVKSSQESENLSIEIEKKKLELTPLGKDFVKSCF